MELIAERVAEELTIDAVENYYTFLLFLKEYRIIKFSANM
jgi:hypothetical protein